MAGYELWNTSSGNIVGAFDSEGAALAVVRDGIAAYGVGYTENLLLGYEDEQGRSTKVAGRGELADLALGRSPV